MNPFVQIRKDLVALAQLAIDNGTHAPDFQQVYVERKIRRVLKKYAVKVRNQPKFKATT